MTDRYIGQLDYGKSCLIPKSVAVCPECGGRLDAECIEWGAEDGKPSTSGLYIDCRKDRRRMEHKYWQSDWQSIVDAIGKWCGAEDV